MHWAANHWRWIAAAALAAIGALIIATAMQRSPVENVIIISLDDLRADRVGALGASRDTTPVLDRLAQRSVVFDNALTQFSSTRYSHKSLFTGRYPFRVGQTQRLAEILSEQGLATAGFTGGGFLDRKFTFDRGFDTYVDRDHYSGLELSVPKAIEWLDANHGDPFFLFLHTYDVHCPFAPPEPFRSMFLEGRNIGFELEGKCENNYFNQREMSAEDFSVLSAVYDGNVRWADSLLAPFFDRLEALGLYDNTMVIVLSDHGERLGEHGDVGHGVLWEEELRVPLIMHIPGVEPLRTREPVQLVDVMPTVLKQLRIARPHAMDGLDLSDIATAKKSLGGRRLRISQGVPGAFAVRVDDHWKLIVDQKGDAKDLYSLEGGEVMVDAAAHAEIREVLADELARVLGEDLQKVSSDMETEALDPDLEARLRALGYLQ